MDRPQAVQILANIVPAMSADSLVAIDEVVMPDEDAHLWPAGFDIQMYTLFGTMERTASQWDTILHKAGLRAVEDKRYSSLLRLQISELFNKCSTEKFHQETICFSRYHVLIYFVFF